VRATVGGSLLAVALLLTACTLSDASGPGADVIATTTTPASASVTGPVPDTVAFSAADEVTTRSLDLVDGSRPTITSTGTYVAATRSLPTTVWVPAGSGPFPMVVFAHGYRVGVGPYERFAEVLAEHGYLVAAPSFPLTDEARAGANLDEADIDHEAADVSFVLTEVLADPELGPVIDASRVGAVGHSDGGSVVLQVGYGPTGEDTRVKAVVAMTGGSPGPGLLHGPPMLLEQSDVDEYNDLSSATELLDQITTPWWFLELHGATHAGPVEGDGTYTALLDATVLAFLDRHLAGSIDDDDAIAAPADANPDLATFTSG
jgi:dienelactone hydrolase